MNKIAIKRHPWTTLSKEMVSWLTERDESLKDNTIELYNPLLIECVETLKPDNWRIAEIEGDEFLTIETDNDVVLIQPKDIEFLKNNFIKIPAVNEREQKRENDKIN